MWTVFRVVGLCLVFVLAGCIGNASSDAAAGDTAGIGSPSPGDSIASDEVIETAGENASVPTPRSIVHGESTIHSVAVCTEIAPCTGSFVTNYGTFDLPENASVVTVDATWVAAFPFADELQISLLKNHRTVAEAKGGSPLELELPEASAPGTYTVAVFYAAPPGGYLDEKVSWDASWQMGVAP